MNEDLFYLLVLRICLLLLLWKMMKVKVMELAHYVERLARNLIYMEGRRMEEGSKFSVFKAFPEDGYSLIVHKGSRITKEAQIRYKLVTTEGDTDTEFFHKLEHTNKGYSETGWLSMSQCDLQTFSCMFEKMVALMSHYHDCYMEGNPSSLLGIDTLMKEDYFMIPAIILLEQKRGTSTTCQYNRYILNSMTGYRSNKGKMMNDIMAYPVRSRVEAFVRSNLFQKDAGFSSHRSKAIIQKQTIEEIHHLKMRNSETMNANVEVDDCFTKKDENHQYNKDFMMLSGYELGIKMKSNPKYVTGILKVATANLHDAMMMTSSLKECKIRTKTLFNSSKKVNTTSHETLKDLIDEHGTPSMLGIISREVFIDAVFSMFPKPQIGGPREILIQSYKLRVHMKFFESICEEFCKMLDKEMLTGSREKEMRQSTTSTEFKRKLINDKIKRNMYGLTPTIVADASRWSPSFTMPMFCHFVIALGLPEEITDHALAVIKSFSAKMMHLPEALCEKWKNKPIAQKEEDEELEWLRTNTDPFTRVHRVTSGMGQGMFHRFSSLIHVAKDDISDQFINDYLRSNGVSFESRTMVSSDDMMKQMLITSTSMKSLLKSIDSLLIIYEVTNRLSNIHINWKKTALSFIIDEFNSYFTVGNRACLAVIKDVFTAMEPVDLTEPLHAVSEVLQNISRALRNGAYLPTVEVMTVSRRRTRTISTTRTL
ncbi:Uncharacterized protein FKW44_014744 [Caligus rogercresseyi]|uniref:RdRp catalytic domain-containing protein n=1 Tax=Caligus rogercresseyi TaxID=217165 RepID=A0A7T8K048_CALRO|nr:Uncharacterized protein FKW44_014742 [Caligus rogercresseyi]QQP40633.1 Uncharacterized protein FKW44_014744 [Caligus rogercresseyi]